MAKRAVPDWARRYFYTLMLEVATEQRDEAMIALAKRELEQPRGRTCDRATAPDGRMSPVCSPTPPAK